MEDTRSERLSAEAVDAALTELPQWKRTRDGAALRRRFQLRTFDEAWALMERIAAVAREQAHHPEILNRYSRVEVSVWTFECEGVTAHDVALARAIDQAAAAE